MDLHPEEDSGKLRPFGLALALPHNCGSPGPSAICRWVH